MDADTGVEFGRLKHAGAVAAQAADDSDDILIPSMPKDATTLRMLDNAVKGRWPWLEPAATDCTLEPNSLASHESTALALSELTVLWQDGGALTERVGATSNGSA